MKTKRLTEQKKNQLARVLASAVNSDNGKRYCKLLRLVGNEGGKHGFALQSGGFIELSAFRYNFDNLDEDYAAKNGCTLDSNKHFLDEKEKTYFNFVEKSFDALNLKNKIGVKVFFSEGMPGGLWKYLGVKIENVSYDFPVDILKQEKTADGKFYVTEISVRKKIDEFEEFYNVCQKLDNAFKNPNKLEKSLRKIENYENKEFGKLLGNPNNWYNKILRRNKK